MSINMASLSVRRGVALCCFTKTSRFAYTGLGRNNGRQLFTKCSGKTKRSGSGWLSRFLSSEAKTTVRAIPVEAGTKARWTGKDSSTQHVVDRIAVPDMSLCRTDLAIPHPPAPFFKIHLCLIESSSLPYTKNRSIMLAYPPPLCGLRVEATSRPHI